MHNNSKIRNYFAIITVKDKAIKEYFIFTINKTYKTVDDIINKLHTIEIDRMNNTEAVLYWKNMVFEWFNTGKVEKEYGGTGKLCTV